MRKDKLRKLQAIKDRAYTHAFQSMQLLNFTVLYYDFDMSKEELTDFSNRLIEMTNKTKDNPNARLMYLEWQAKVIEEWGRNPSATSLEMPYRALAKMVGGISPRDAWASSDIVIQGYEAVEQLITAAFMVLMEHNNFRRADMDKWWERIKGNSDNYIKGMTDDFVFEYFQNELGEKIQRVI